MKITTKLRSPIMNNYKSVARNGNLVLYCNVADALEAVIYNSKTQEVVKVNPVSVTARPGWDPIQDQEISFKEFPIK